MEPEAVPGQEIPIDLAGYFGAEAGIGFQCFSLYVPNKDKNDREIGTQRRWVLEALQLLCEINGGASAIPIGGLVERGKPDHLGTSSRCLLVCDQVGRLRETLAAVARVPSPHGSGDESGRSRFRVRRPFLSHPPI
jgi:hypothetical protein